MSSTPPTPPMRRGGRAASPRTGHGGWRPGWSSRTSRRVAPSGLINVTDHDSRVVRTHGQPPLQGYNAQAGGQRAPGRRRRRDHHRLTRLRPPRTDGPRHPTRTARGIELGDPRSCSPTPATGISARSSTSLSDGMQVLVPPDGGLRKGARPGWTGGLYDFMRRVLATPEGRDPLPPAPDHRSSPSSARSSSTARSNASNAAAEPPAEANGD